MIWLTSPALAGVALCLLGGDGWKDAGLSPRPLSGWKWYVVALLGYPLGALIVTALALAIGILSLEGFVAKGFMAYPAAAGAMLTGSLLKNIFEEFAWRGYLTPRLDAAKVHPLLNHTIVGFLWWSWHLPYYYYFLDRATLDAAITTEVPVFLAVGLFVMLPTSILFGELRLVSKSVWTGFVMHSVVNALSMPLLINGFIKLQEPFGFVFTPTNEGVLTALLLGVIGWFIYRYRKKKAMEFH